MTESAAGQLARQDGITLEATNVTSSDQPQGTIITQSPAPNSVLQKNEVVDVTVSNGPQLVDVPYVFGESVQQAKQTLQAAGFKVTVSGPDFFGQVWDTDPSPYTPAPHGSTVVLETNFNLGGGNGNGGGGNGGGGPGGF
jgi:beta-lactam-binding protein with PASTA domain